MERKKVKYFQVAQGVWGMKLFFVNVYVIANRRGQAKGWVLVDTGVKGSAKKIITMAESIFGPGTQPKAIILTHGHLDHTGSLNELLKYWKVPVYAHELELPYLTGKSSYPPADPTVGGGMVSLMSMFFRLKPINLGNRIKAIDVRDGIPELPEWRIIETPGHSPGHISLFFPLNTTLIAGDAVSTTKPESLIYGLWFLKKFSGPPKYITMDWDSAERSVQKINELEPRIIAPGHGYVMRGRELQAALQSLSDNFEELAIPESGRYVPYPAIADEEGVKYVPPFKTNIRFSLKLTMAAAILTFAITRTLDL